VAEALFDLLGSLARPEEEDGPEGPKRKRPRPTKREEQDELTQAAAPAGRKSAADGGGSARKLDRRTDAADAARRGGGSTGAGAGGRADAGLRTHGRGAADGALRPALWRRSCARADSHGLPGCVPHAGALARAGLANAQLPQLPFPLFPGLAPGLGYMHTAGGWPQAFGVGAGVDSAVAAQQLLLPPRRFKHCASHVYIAHFIDHQQQQQRFHIFQQQMSGGFPAGVIPPDAGALAGGGAADLANRRLPPVAPFGLLAGYDRAGAASAPALAAAQLQYAQVCAPPRRPARAPPHALTAGAPNSCSIRSR